MQYLVIALIRMYQETISPDHGLMKVMFPGGVCRYTPTCSEYAIDAVRTYGVARGIAVSACRIFRCNPLFKGGFDPLPPKGGCAVCSHSVARYKDRELKLL